MLSALHQGWNIPFTTTVVAVELVALETTLGPASHSFCLTRKLYAGEFFLSRRLKRFSQALSHNSEADGLYNVRLQRLMVLRCLSCSINGRHCILES